MRACIFSKENCSLCLYLNKTWQSGVLYEHDYRHHPDCWQPGDSLHTEQCSVVFPSALLSSTHKYGQLPARDTTTPSRPASESGEQLGSFLSSQISVAANQIRLQYLLWRIRIISKLLVLAFKLTLWQPETRRSYISINFKLRFYIRLVPCLHINLIKIKFGLKFK